MKTQPASLLSFLNELRDARISYELAQHRQEAIMVKVTVPGERWEIEFLEDGSVEAEVFRSDGQILDASVLPGLIERNRD
jgi:hypothetical protein